MFPIAKSMTFLSALTGLLFLTGCFHAGNDAATEQTNFAMMLGEISCGGMESGENFTDEEAQAIAVKYGFGTWTEEDLNTYIEGLDTTSQAEIKTTGISYINDNCATTFEESGVAPEAMIDLLLTSEY